MYKCKLPMVSLDPPLNALPENALDHSLRTSSEQHGEVQNRETWTAVLRIPYPHPLASSRLTAVFPWLSASALLPDHDTA